MDLTKLLPERLSWVTLSVTKKVQQVILDHPPQTLGDEVNQSSDSSKLHPSVALKNSTYTKKSRLYVPKH
eukprot:CAMPEP_0196805654 /NCGR_PEP_ID=MMETSP1362-20130617/5456_1 /TAXON_ID=163516 /ORGANISM="Leptocylindrus danicus, Strain CCMP1856" /LENGTH=69 /DNA_ID=CAMNT_0042178707 /DNA_START=139 /DNA_END=348 /DNA_ORIENTATION=+